MDRPSSCLFAVSGDRSWIANIAVMDRSSCGDGGTGREDAWGGRFPSLEIVLWSHNGWTSSTKHGASRERIGDVRGQADVSGTCEWREEVGVDPDGKKRVVEDTCRTETAAEWETSFETRTFEPRTPRPMEASKEENVDQSEMERVQADFQDGRGEEKREKQEVVGTHAEVEEPKLPHSLAAEEEPVEESRKDPQHDPTTKEDEIGEEEENRKVSTPGSMESLSVNSSSATNDRGEDQGLDLQAPPESPDGMVSSAFVPLRLACKTRQTQIMEPALDTLQRLIAHGYLRGSTNGLKEDGLCFETINLVCQCYDVPDEAIELKVLRVLLTLVTSSTFQVHDEALLKVIRTCYNVYLGSKSEVNRSTAKASLIQMITIVFKRMEADSSSIPIETVVVAKMLPPEDFGDERQPFTNFVQNFINRIVADAEATFYAAPPATIHDDAFISGKVVQNPVLNEDGALEGLEDKEERKVADSEPEPVDLSSATELQRDAFLVFRSLCKLATRDPSTPTDPYLMKGKILALELLRILLENAGREFIESEIFVQAMKEHLCLALLKNCSTDSKDVVKVLNYIFATICLKFRAKLKSEIGVFYPLIVLKQLEDFSGTRVPYWHRAVVVHCLQKVCSNAQTLVDFFVNYDCDLESVNLFDRTVLSLIQLVQGLSYSAEVAEMMPAQAKALRNEAMNCLVLILQSLLAWPSEDGGGEKPSQDADRGSVISEISPDSESSQGASELLQAGENGGSAPPKEDAGFPLHRSTSNLETREIEKRRAHKLGYQAGISLFNNMPLRGMISLQESGYVGHSPTEVAVFLQATPGLEKSKIGEYLGGHTDECVAVMHAYVDSFDFMGISFDVAIRNFLSGFRLPGEAQKIDRLMEKFAERYYACNPGSFRSADVAYVLSYSVIMLNTDAHNPQVKHKMSREDFIKNNRGIDDGEDLNQDFLENLYNQIVRYEIKMSSDSYRPHLEAGKRPGPAGVDAILNLLPGRRAHPSFEAMPDDVIRSIRDKMEGKSDSMFYVATNYENMKPMLEAVWAPLLAAFSMLLEDSMDDFVVKNCLQGFRAVIGLSATLYMQTVRDTFVSALSRFTYMRTPEMMLPKHVGVFRALLGVAEEYGNLLEDSWMYVLESVSYFEYIHQQVHGMSDAFLFSPDHLETASPKEEVNGGSKYFKLLSRKGSSNTSHVAPGIAVATLDSLDPDRVNSGIISQGLPPPGILDLVDASEVDRLFASSGNLSSDAIVHFVQALCMISQREIASHHTPRVFSLTKIVEISQFNMNRIRIVWSRVWTVLGPYFAEVGCHPNLSVALYAVDSLRQLAMKFLERDELANYTFQDDFLRPFVLVMRKSKSVEIRELVIRCVSQMVLARVSNIKSGWKSMFMVFTTAAADSEKAIVQLAFETIEKVVREYFMYVTETEVNTFTDCVNCLIAFTSTRYSPDVSLNAIAFLRFCALKLAEGEIGNIEHGEQSGMPERAAASGPLFSEKEAHMFFWFPLLAGLSELTFDPRPEIRHSALEVLFDILNYHGLHFTEGFWERVFSSVLLPMFDHVRAEITDATTFEDSARRAEIDAWLYETCNDCLDHVLSLYRKFQPYLKQVFPQLISLLVGFVRRPHERLAAIGMHSYLSLLQQSSSQFDEKEWRMVLTSLQEAAADTLPDIAILTEPRTRRISLETESGTENCAKYRDLKLGAGARKLAEVKTRTKTQLLVVSTISQIYGGSFLEIPSKYVDILLDVVNSCAAHARKVNSDAVLRARVIEAEEESELPNAERLPEPPLQQLEDEASHAYLSILMHALAIEKTEGASSIWKDANVEERLVQFSMLVLDNFLPKEEEKGLEVATVTARTPLVVAVLRALLSFAEEEFKMHLSELMPILTHLIEAEYSPSEVTKAVSEVLVGRMGKLVAEELG